MPISAQRIKGKLKREIAHEAFRKLGPNATVLQVDQYFRKFYNLPHCERSMYATAKRQAEGKIVVPRLRYPRHKTLFAASLVVRTKQLAADLGGYDKLKELIEVLK